MLATGCSNRRLEIRPNAPSRAAARGNSLSRYLHADNVARFALGDNFKRPTADFAIRSETLPRQTGVDDYLASLATVGAYDVGKLFHVAI